MEITASDHEKTATETHSGPSPTIEPPPDGGWKAWTQVLIAHLVVFNTWGAINSFGIFQDYYEINFGEAPSTISWIGSVQNSLVFAVGIVSGRGTDGGYFRQLAFAGSLLQVIGVFMTSLCTEFWQLFLAQGICQGLGGGLIFCPAVTLISTYFTRKRAFALSIVASGTATGGVVFPVIAQQLLPTLGFPWTIRIMAFIILFNNVLVLLFARTRTPPRSTGPLIEWAAFGEVPYLLFSLGIFFVFWGNYFAYYYVRANVLRF